MTVSEVEVETGGGSESSGSSLRDRVLGIVGGAMLVAALAVLVAGAPGDDGQAIAGVPAPLVLVSPVDGDAVSGPVELVFTASGADLAPNPTGWGAEGFHVHAELDGVERMPAMADIRRTDDRYAWMLADPPAGEITVRLLWSDSRHRPVPDGASEAVTVTIQ